LVLILYASLENKFFFFFFFIFFFFIVWFSNNPKISRLVDPVPLIDL